MHGVLVNTLVDTGASVDILYWNTFIQLRMGDQDMIQCHVPVQEFGKTEVPMVGTVTVLVTLGKGGQGKTVQVKFIVVQIN